MEDNMDLDGWLRKSGGLPEGEPGLDEGVEVSSPENGGKVAGIGKAEGSVPTVPGQEPGAPSPETDKLSEDDAEVERQMTEHKKPIERLGKSLDDSRSVIADDPVEGPRRHARQLSELRKSHDVTIAPSRVEPEPLAKAEPGQSFTVGRGDQLAVQYRDDLDRYIEKSIQGPDADQFYPHGRPSIGALGDLRKSRECGACGLQKSLALSACPHCGDGAVIQGMGVGRGNVMVKSERPGPAIRRPPSTVEVLPGGIIVVDE